MQLSTPVRARQRTAQSCLFSTRIRHGRPKSAIPSHRAQMPERFWNPVQTYASDGGARPNSGGTPFRQPCPAYPSTIGQKAPQVRFSEESFRQRLSIRKRISQKLSCKINCAHRRTENSQRTASLNELAEPINYNKRSQTSSTHDFASHERMRGASANPTKKASQTCG